MRGVLFWRGCLGGRFIRQHHAPVLPFAPGTQKILMLRHAGQGYVFGVNCP
jgi:hypothetical protein